MSFHLSVICGRTTEIDCLGTGTGLSTVQTSRLPPCSMAHLTALEVMAIRSI